MSVELQIERMTLEEKLRAMEALWTNLCLHEEQLPSPPWHERILRDREARVLSGEEKFEDWETVKKQLRDRLT